MSEVESELKIGIIGNGIIALTSALELLRQDSTCRILLIGPANRNMAGSVAAAAMLNSFAEIESGYLDSELNQQKFQHSVEATSLWPGFLEFLESESKVNLNHGLGTFVIANSLPGEIEGENFSAIEKALVDYRAKYELREVQSIPGLKFTQEGRSSRGLFIHGEGWVDTAPTLEALMEILGNAERVQFIDGTVSEILSRPGSSEITLQLADLKEVKVDKVLVANGAKARNFLTRLGLNSSNPGVLFGIGTTVRLKVSDLEQSSVIRTPNRGLACGLYSAPYRPDQLVIGATNQVTDSERELPSVEDVRSLLTMAQRELNYDLAKAEILKINTGYRPVSTDGVPLIGKVPMSNVYLCTGTRRDGWHLSPYLSRHIARMILTDDPVSELQIYSPAREPYRLITREKSIELAAQHYISGMYQHGLQMPFGAYREHMVRNYENYFTDLHDYAGIHEFGIPIEMIGYASGKMARGEKINV